MRDHSDFATSICVASLCCVIVLMPTLQGCAAFDRFKPIITTTGHELLAELDELLTEYESATIPLDASSAEYVELSLDSIALRAKIENRLYHASLEAPADAVRPYQKRLRAVPAAGP